MTSELAGEQPPAKDVLHVLVENHRRFLGFLKGKVGSEATAEEILQAAFVKYIETSATIRDEESIVAWFYRVLRNAVVDHHRRRGTEERALSQLAAEMPETIGEAPAEVIGPVCACVGDLLTTLRPEDGDLIRTVDINGTPIVAAAAKRGISAGNARVRLHRARQALRRRVEEACGTCAVHGCLDCTCARGSSPRSCV